MRLYGAITQFQACALRRKLHVFWEIYVVHYPSVLPADQKSRGLCVLDWMAKYEERCGG